MWYRCGALAVLAWILGCGNEAPEARSPGAQSPAGENTTESPAPVVESPESSTGFRLSIDGWAEEIGAKAQLNVTEGVRAVHLAITGGGQQDLVFLDVDFDGLAGSMGPHLVEVGLPDTELDTAIASLGGRPYHSQAGHIDVTLSKDGNIAGSFDIMLAEDPESINGRPPVFVLSNELRSLSGNFNGRWQLLCQSHLDGHMSLMVGGDYCDNLEF